MSPPRVFERNPRASRNHCQSANPWILSTNKPSTRGPLEVPAQTRKASPPFETLPCRPNGTTSLATKPSMTHIRLLARVCGCVWGRSTIGGWEQIGILACHASNEPADQTTPRRANRSSSRKAHEKTIETRKGCGWKPQKIPPIQVTSMVSCTKIRAAVSRRSLSKLPAISTYPTANGRAGQRREVAAEGSWWQRSGIGRTRAPHTPKRSSISTRPRPGAQDFGAWLEGRSG